METEGFGPSSEGSSPSFATGDQKKRCLVVEDNSFAGDILAVFLQRQGFVVDVAENGRIAVEKFLSAPDRYGIIFMDLQMPVMSGYEATERIRRSGERGAQIPIILMSGETLNDLQQYGFTDCLRKPFSLPMLLPLLEVHFPA